MSDIEANSLSSHSSISITSTHEGASIHSSISGDSRLNDHRHQSMSLPIKTDNKGTSVSLNKMRSNRNNSLESDTSVKPLQILTEQSDLGPSKMQMNPDLNSRELRERMVVEDDDDEYAIKFQDRFKRDNQDLSFTANTVPSPLNVGDKRRTSRTRSRSFSEQVRNLIRPKEDTPGSILIGSRPSGNDQNVSQVRVRMDTLDPINPISKTISRASSKSERRISISKDDNDSDLDSHASRESQETEEDVCFPMIPENVRVQGIDFNELESFIAEQREENELIAKREEELKRSSNRSVTTSSDKLSTAALKYTPKYATSSEESQNEKCPIAGSVSSYEPGVTFDPESNKIEDLPTRFSFFSSEMEETIHAPDMTSLTDSGQLLRELFEPEDSTWWLDCTCPTDLEMKVLAKAFGIHPLTAEDIRMQETREKVELFKSYYFVCFHTFETDQESEDFLEPINVYMVVFRTGMLTFHFSPIVNPANVRRRVRQLRDYVNVSADWLCYAMIDDITDGFAPIIHAIEYEADSIEDSVFLTREKDFGSMLLKIGESRRKVMTLMRLLQGKADVIKMFAKRCQDEAARLAFGGPTSGNTAQPRGDIALFLGDIQDHIITMFQSLLSYEKIFSRSHTNYLAQLQVESFYTNNKVTDLLSKVTLLGTIMLPLNLVTGLFGMNVKVPGEGGSNYHWFGGIIGFISFIIIISFFVANYYLRSMEDNSRTGLTSLSVSNLRFGSKRNRERTERPEMVSLPTKFTKYGEW